jgi:hypothetical protein
VTTQPTLPTMRLGICLPSGSLVHAEFAISLAVMIQFLCREQIPGYGNTQLGILNKRTSILSASREGLIQDCQKQKFTHALFIDSDQSFPFFAVHQLAQHKLPVIGANIATKMIPSTPSARNSVSERKPVYSHDKEDVEEVQYIGFGLTLIDLSIFDFIPQPWFPVEWRDGLGYVGEDLSFCDKVSAAGYKIYVDHALSQEVLHVGDYAFGHKDIPRNFDDQNPEN